MGHSDLVHGQQWAFEVRKQPCNDTITRCNAFNRSSMELGTMCHFYQGPLNFKWWMFYSSLASLFGDNFKMKFKK
jgi:hypothetical protein